MKLYMYTKIINFNHRQSWVMRESVWKNTEELSLLFGQKWITRMYILQLIFFLRKPSGERMGKTTSPGDRVLKKTRNPSTDRLPTPGGKIMSCVCPIPITNNFKTQLLWDILSKMNDDSKIV